MGMMLSFTRTTSLSMCGYQGVVDTESYVVHELDSRPRVLLIQVALEKKSVVFKELMGRRGNMKGRPGLLFVTFICVCLIIFYFSWQMLMSPKFEKDTVSVLREAEHIKSRLSGQSWKNSQNIDSVHNIQQVPPQSDENQMPGPFADSSKKEFSIKADQESSYSMLKNEGIDLEPANPDDKRPFSALGRNKESKSKSDQSTSESSLRNAILNENNFYLQPIASIEENLKSMDRLVHLDFKGAVPNMEYLRNFIPLLETLGATGLLVEYEDMFPYSGDLETLKATNAFSEDQLSEFLQLAKRHNMKVIPLIQTFGHMEFVLKSATFGGLRESSYTPQVIDMTNGKSYAIITAMIKQVLDAHPDATHLHIGCDEVYELGKGASATMMQEKRLTVDQMFVHHVKKVAKIVLQFTNSRVTPIIWDDMLRKMPEKEIINSSLPTYVDIMVWHYTPNVTGIVGEETFAKYEKIFKYIWIASSFKGATGSRQFYTEPLYHIQNHFSWLQVIQEHQKNIRFRGIALTGWQRYDHFATLCELLPVAIPSLAVCLATIKNGGFTEAIHGSVSTVLKCDGKIEMSFPEIDKKTKMAKITQDCRFPGSDVYYAMQDFYAYTQISTQHRLDGWLSDYQIAHGFTSPGQMKVLAMDLNKQNNGFSRTMDPLKLHLLSIYSSEDVAEWLEENIYERKRHNEQILEKIHGLINIKTWPRRPLAATKLNSVSNYEQSKVESNPTSKPSVNRKKTDLEQDARQNVGNHQMNVNRPYNGMRQGAGFSLDHGSNNENRKIISKTHNMQGQDQFGKIRNRLGANRHSFASNEEENDTGHRNLGGFPQRIDTGRMRLPVDERDPNNNNGRIKARKVEKLNDKNKQWKEPGDRRALKFRSDKDELLPKMEGYSKARDVIGLNLIQKDNQGNKQESNIDNIAQFPHYRKPDGVPEKERAGTKLSEGSDVNIAISQARKKPVMNDFHDAQMNHYEERLIKAAEHKQF
ncbi:hexosaminidase d [Plakobranchus ocellatus]|uniref:beta-N-acetylhexosaminidase n=1 Tax=Plakobranchus ocellatus TaxID=259542 RepID=A0AAV4B2D3_9GAST|nr:hexosaminidase d [Plakobranchus ocellatus]